ncbi:MAG: hypothetical protein ACRYFB_10180 [Janthinobacterium lividum]
MELKAEQISDQDKHLVILKIPINLPYQTDWKDFEPTDGETVIKGITYKYVKRKVSRDTLILLCLEHQDKTQLEKSSDDYFKKSSGLESNPSKKIENKQAQEFYISKNTAETGLTGALIRQFYVDKRSIVLHFGYHQLIENPPEENS